MLLITLTKASFYSGVSHNGVTVTLFAQHPPLKPETVKKPSLKAFLTMTKAF